MFRHVLKLIWNRKRTQALILAELVITFLIVFLVAALGWHAYSLWTLPLGFTWHDTLGVTFDTGGQWTEDDGRTLQRLLSTVRDQPEVEWAHLSQPLFRNWTWSTGVEFEGRSTKTLLNQMSDGAPQDFGVELVEGRWFDAGDRRPDTMPVVIDERLSRTLFPGGVVLGADIYPQGEQQDTSWIVVGVFRAFRQMGEFTVDRPYLIGRFPVEDLATAASSIQVRLREGTTPEVEERLQQLVQAEAPGWSFTIAPAGKLRSEQIRNVVTPLSVGALVAAFLLLMVAFGLFGVLWQNVTRRTDELGLRRAIGSSRRQVVAQIVLETVVLTGLSVLLGTLVAVQIPLSGGVPSLDWPASSAGLAIAALVLLLLATLCSLYPAWLAARRPPAEALHYE